MIMAMLRLVPRPEKRQEAIRILTRVANEIQLMPGCVSSSVYYEELSPEQAILCVEMWQSEEGLSRHIQSNIYRWTLAAMELASDPPEICFHQISETRGLEMVESLRGSREQTG
jgi:quinol monooxygenase YgiN